MNKTRIKIYYILTFLFFFTLFYLNDIIELFIVSVTHEQESTLNENNTENVITNVVSSDIVSSDVVSQDYINSSSSLKSVSLRDDKEFQESIARMEELIEYSRSNDITVIPEKIDIDPIVNVSRTELLNVNNRESHPFSYNYFDDGLDVKLNDKSRLHIDENSHITVCNESSVNIDDSSINLNESSVNIDDEDTESDNTVISDTQITLDWNEDEVFEYPDSDSENIIGHSSSQHLPPPSGMRSQAINSNLPLIEQSTSSGENTYAKSYLGSLNDPDLNRIIGVSSENTIHSDDTINTNKVDKESTTTTTTTTTSTNTNNSRTKRTILYRTY